MLTFVLLPFLSGCTNVRKYNALYEYEESLKLINDIKGLDFFAVREGQLSFSGWKLKKQCYKEKNYSDGSFILDLAQKGVDIKIGLDIAWISYNNISERILLIMETVILFRQ